MIVVFDTDKIKDYVFATNKLKEIVGASAILNYLNKNRIEKEVHDICGDGNFEKIYADGGGAAFKVPKNKGDKVIKAVKKLYLRETSGGAHITGIKYTGQSDSEYSFTEISEKIRREKESKKAETKINEGTVSLVSLPYMHFCDSCGKRYATTVVKDPDGEDEWLCPVCFEKRNFFHNHEDIKPLDEVLKEYIDNLRDIPPSQNFDDIASGDGYIALIYADGNEIGKNMERIKSIDELKVFSMKMNKAMKEAVSQALSDIFNDKKNRFAKLPFKVLLLAGDDLVLSINADFAFPVAVKIAENFEKHFKDREDLSLSIGIVISHKNFPFKQSLNYATSLLSYTKKKRAEIKVVLKESIGSMVSFAALSVAIPSSPERYIREYLSMKKNNKSFQFTAQPYTIYQMQKLIEYVKRLKKNGFPRSKLSEVREAVYSGGFSTVIDIYNIITKLDKGNRHVFERLIEGGSLELERNLQSGKFPTYPHPWFVGESDIIFTHLLDVVDMYKFVQEE